MKIIFRGKKKREEKLAEETLRHYDKILTERMIWEKTPNGYFCVECMLVSQCLPARIPMGSTAPRLIEGKQNQTENTPLTISLKFIGQNSW